MNLFKPSIMYVYVTYLLNYYAFIIYHIHFSGLLSFSSILFIMYIFVMINLKELIELFNLVLVSLVYFHTVFTILRDCIRLLIMSLHIIKICILYYVGGYLIHNYALAKSPGQFIYTYIL